jgi:1-deoxy-D-xylulose-5-phosphate synthase
VVTKKGIGYRFAEEDPAKFHGIGKFDPSSGSSLSGKTKTYSDVFGETMLELAAEDSRVCAITAAMPGGTGLLKFRQAYPKRLFDVGIAEEHAVSMAGGLAKQGMVPIVALYSTFLQRSYDQIMQDVALLGLHVVFAIDRVGLVGEDGPTHHGVFDVGFLRQIPGMTVLCPANFEELRAMLKWAVRDCTGPVAVRYPRGSSEVNGSCFNNNPTAICSYSDQAAATLVSYGTVSAEMLSAATMLQEEGIGCTVLRLLSATHYSCDELVKQVRGKHVFVIEEVCSGSGISGEIALALKAQGLDCTVHALDLGREFTPHGDTRSLYRLTGLDRDAIVNSVREVWQHEN